MKLTSLRRIGVCVFVGALLNQLILLAQTNGSPTEPNTSASAIERAGKAHDIPNASALAEAITCYRNGRLDEAEQRYQQLLQVQPKLGEAYAGLARVYLKQKKVQQAQEIISKALAVADCPTVRVALGEVLFRQGKLLEAETEWLNVVKSGHSDARAHLGLARLSIASAQYVQAKREIDEAHRLDPGDPDIQFYWIRVDPLGAKSDGSPHTCHLATDLASKQTDLIVFGGGASNQIRGYGLAVALDGQSSKLLIDTGAHGILIDRKIAQRAGLSKISDTTVGGFGDQGKSAGYVAHATDVKIGPFEFRDCTVTVIDKRSILGEDGFIGTDVFENYLIDLDFPNKKLQLGDLPERRDEDQAAGDYASLEHRFRPAAFSSSFAPVYRFGHLLLVPTQVGESSDVRLFAIDTGAPKNLFSVNAAREMSKVRENARMEIKGLSGSVRRVYDAEKTGLYFANVQQYAERGTALNLEGMSDTIGTELSGVLGAFNLRTLVVTIDYRDGFVGFDFNPDR